MPDGELNEFQLERAIKEAEWRGGVTNELKNINKTQNNGFIALNKRFDRLEVADAAYRKANDKKVGIIKSAVNKLKMSNIKTAATVGLLTTIVFLILSKIINFV